MDFTLLLLMHTLRGLKLSPHELLAVLEESHNSAPALEQHLKSALARAYLTAHPDWVEESLQWLDMSERQQIRWSRLGDVNYPVEWLELSHSPPVFSFQGEAVWKATPLLAVVGSRTPMSGSRLWMQRELSYFLRGKNIGVVSGGARGIDQWAHRLCIDEGRPTVCVLPSGLLNPYPPDTQPLWSAVRESGGCLLSTFALHEGMRKFAFEVRNRWITGLARMLLVVEANRRSGSAMTAKLALEEQREICTLPVFPHSEQGLANLDLLVNGANLIRDHHDLTTAWDRNSRPTLFQRAQREHKEKDIDHPQPDGRGNPATAGETFGRDIQDPVRNKQS